MGIDSKICWPAESLTAQAQKKARAFFLKAEDYTSFALPQCLHLGKSENPWLTGASVRV
jgi:hypothetical protein